MASQYDSKNRGNAGPEIPGRGAKALDYVNHFYRKYRGRVAIGVGYNENLSEIYPFIFQNSDKESIGVVALGVPAGQKNVHIYHLGAFQSRQGDGTAILEALCCKADEFQVTLSVSPVPLDNGRDAAMNSAHLIQWYERFDFIRKENAALFRRPGKSIENG